MSILAAGLAVIGGLVVLSALGVAVLIGPQALREHASRRRLAREQAADGVIPDALTQAEQVVFGARLKVEAERLYPDPDVREDGSR